MNSNEIDSLIKLLDDTDTEIFSHIENKLLSLGNEVVPFLEDAWINSFDVSLQKRIEKIIHQIQITSLQNMLSLWAKTESGDLLKGAMLIAKYQYPDMNEKKVFEFIEKLSRDIWVEINENLTALETVRVFNHIFFNVYGFSGNTTNYHAPQNSFINIVIESRKGNPLSLSIIYILVAQKLNLPFYGVNLPEHFILAYTDTQHIITELPEDINKRILFYINVFSKGMVFNRKEIDDFLRQLHIAPRIEYYEPCSNTDIIKRLIRNLMYSYQKLGYIDKLDDMQMLMNTLEI